MPKMKTSRAAAKRFNVNLRKPAMTDATNVKNMKKILPYI